MQSSHLIRHAVRAEGGLAGCGPTGEGVMMGNELQVLVEYAPLLAGILMVVASWI